MTSDADRRAMPEECPAPCKTPDMCREEEGCLLGYGAPLFDSEEDRAAFVDAAKGKGTVPACATCGHPLSSHDVNPHSGDWFCEEYCCPCSTSPVAPDAERRVRVKVAAEIEREFSKACYATPALRDYRDAGLNTAASVRDTAAHLKGSEPDAFL